MAIINFEKNYLKTTLDLGIFSDILFEKRLFTPFLKEKSFDGTGLDYVEDLYKEYATLDLELDAEDEGIEIDLTGVSNVRSLTIFVKLYDPNLLVQPDVEVFLDSTDNQKLNVRGLLHIQFSDGPTKVIVNNPTLYKKIFKIVYCGG